MQSKNEIILNSIVDGVFTVDLDWRITYFNAAAERITGIPAEEAMGRFCAEIFKADICEGDCVMKRTMNTGQPISNETVKIIRSDGKTLRVAVSTALLRDKDGKVTGGVETFRDISTEFELRKKLARSYSFEDIVSKNHRMQELFDILPDIAGSGSTVLIEGESGTGKELFARAIHSLSPGREGRMVTVNCGALPDTLLESELFGYRKGAFTDAARDKPGRFALAEGGTIFLDEIGEISPAMQVRLLRVLQDGIYEPLGSNEPVHSDARVIAATNTSLRQLVSEGKFRKDLYYRINVVRIHIPPLRERRDDIPLLAGHFIDRFNRLRNKNIRDLSPEVLSILMAHDFPGNVRELENIIEHAFVLCRGDIIEPAHLPGNLREAEKEADIGAGGGLEQIEAEFIKNVLRRNDWNRTRAARELGVHKTTLWRKINRLDLELPPVDGRSSPEKSGGE
ncbi:MAG: sigma 54-interacting transcriptional regulator [Candidatus Krumholzibacteriales bacterium]